MFRSCVTPVYKASASRIFIASRQISVSAVLLSGHSRWSTIKRDKAKQDLHKADLSFKIAQQITIAVKNGGPDPDSNPGLVNCLEKAKKLNVAKKVIENAIKRASGQGDSKSGNLETVTYEGMGPQGVAVIVELLTDNKSRTIGFLKPCFSKVGGQLTPTAYMFEKKGFITVDIGSQEFDDIFEKFLEAGAEDIEELPVDSEENPDGNLLEVTTEPTETSKVSNILKDAGFKVTDQNIGYKPKDDMMVELSEEQKSSVEKFLSKIDEVDDVSNVYTNIRE